MRKVFLFAISLFAIIGNLQAQDLIVTNSGDSINCKITKITKDYVHFIFKYNAEIRSTLLPTNQVAVHHKDYFSVSELPANYTHKDVFPHLRFAIDGGWQYRTAKIVDGVDLLWRKHLKEMKSGFHYDIQAAYFFLESHGAELMFSQQFFGHDSGRLKLNEKVSFNYIGANYLFRLFDSEQQNCWLFSVGLGYMGYNNRSLLNNENMKMTAGTLGSNVAIGYDIGLSGGFGMGFKLSLMGGSFRNYKLTKNGITTNETYPDNISEGLGTIKLSVGLRFNQ